MTNGDFLSGFSGKQDNSKKPDVSTTAGTKHLAQTPFETKSQEIKKRENKMLADAIVASEDFLHKPVAPAQSDSAIIKAPVHAVTKDETYHKRKLIKSIIIGSFALVIAVIGFVVFQIRNTVEMPNWVGQEVERNTGLDMWRVNTRITFTQEYAYSLEFDAGRIMEQSVAPGENVRRGSSVRFTVSNGPDMSQRVTLPDFYDMNRASIRTWVEENRMRNITFVDESHPTIPQHHVVRLEFPPTADELNFRRSDSLRIVMSSGPETVQISNMVGNEWDEVLAFIEDNPSIVVDIEYEPHERIARGNVLAQNVPSGTRLPLGETLVLTVSAGMPVEVPDFSVMRMIEVTEMETDPEGLLKIDFSHRYNDHVIFGRFVSQSVAPKTLIYDDATTVDVVFSRGRPWIPKMIGESEDGLVQRFVEINDLGAQLMLDVRYVNHHANRGEIVNQSIYGVHVPLNQTIRFEISRGNLSPPDLPDVGNDADEF